MQQKLQRTVGQGWIMGSRSRRAWCYIDMSVASLLGSLQGSYNLFVQFKKAVVAALATKSDFDLNSPIGSLLLILLRSCAPQDSCYVHASAAGESSKLAFWSCRAPAWTFWPQPLQEMAFTSTSTHNAATPTLGPTSLPGGPVTCIVIRFLRSKWHRRRIKAQSHQLNTKFNGRHLWMM